MQETLPDLAERATKRNLEASGLCLCKPFRIGFRISISSIFASGEANVSLFSCLVNLVGLLSGLHDTPKCGKHGECMCVLVLMQI